MDIVSRPNIKTFIFMQANQAHPANPSKGKARRAGRRPVNKLTHPKVKHDGQAE
jgi:hypothetical protein